MEIDFKNRKVERQCRSLSVAKKEFSDKIAKKLIKLINFIDATENLKSLISNPVYHFHPLVGDKKGLYAMDIDGRSKSYRLIVSFDGYNTKQVFVEFVSIFEIKVEEVSKHYE